MTHVLRREVRYPVGPSPRLDTCVIPTTKGLEDPYSPQFRPPRVPFSTPQSYSGPLTSLCHRIRVRDTLPSPGLVCGPGLVPGSKPRSVRRHRTGGRFLSSEAHRVRGVLPTSSLGTRSQESLPGDVYTHDSPRV